MYIEVLTTVVLAVSFHRTTTPQVPLLKTHVFWIPFALMVPTTGLFLFCSLNFFYLELGPYFQLEIMALSVQTISCLAGGSYYLYARYLVRNSATFKMIMENFSDARKARLERMSHYLRLSAIGLFLAVIFSIITLIAAITKDSLLMITGQSLIISITVLSEIMQAFSFRADRNQKSDQKRPNSTTA
jgi:hypothetical protein